MIESFDSIAVLCYSHNPVRQAQSKYAVSGAKHAEGPRTGKITLVSNEPFALPGYEDLEISTQILIRDALNRGVDVKVLDRKSNFLELSAPGRKELVKQATKTSKDSYIAFLVMENKTVSKQLLSEAGIRVPDGETFAEPEAALRFARSCSWQKVVIKPATTNFGIGISVIDPRGSAESLTSAISQAFSFAETILVEEYVEGGEYRFLVVDNETIAVCQRIPANVRGNGNSSIGELIAEKNRDPRRGRGHVTPLEQIELGKTELGVLREDYGYDEHSIPAEGEIIYLRKNSNISTGGDSIDVTDTTHAFYKRIAEEAAKTVGARISGVDMIMLQPEVEGDYVILELNFNPVLYIHNYPYEGSNRRVGEKILDLLGF